MCLVHIRPVESACNRELNRVLARKACVGKDLKELKTFGACFIKLITRTVIKGSLSDCPVILQIRRNTKIRFG